MGRGVAIIPLVRSIFEPSIFCSRFSAAQFDPGFAFANVLSLICVLKFIEVLHASLVHFRIRLNRRITSQEMSSMQSNRQEGDLGVSNKEGEVRRLAAIMFTDIVGYTSMSQNNESLALDLLDEHRSIFRPILATHGGEEIKTIGDSFLVEFRSALDAVRCAISMQEALAKRNVACTSVRQIQVRIGIHVGDVVRIGNDVYGDTVNLAQRIESSSEPGGVAISAQVYEQVKNKIAFPIEKLGEYQLKNVALPTLLYTIHPMSTERKQGMRRLFIPSRLFIYYNEREMEGQVRKRIQSSELN